MTTAFLNLPISREAFMSEYFERSMLHAPSALKEQSYTWRQFSNDFYAIEPGLGLVRLYRAGGMVDKSQYMKGSERDVSIAYDFQPDGLRTLLKSGGSMVVNRFDKASAYAGHLCRELAVLTGHTTVGNAYATQGGNGTFGKHWDTHCVFAVQLIGAKRWKVFRPTLELPLAFQTSRTLKQSFAGEAVFDAILKAGDILYMPRGWWHEATPIEGSPSLHIAVGVHTPKVHEYIRWVLTSKMPEHLCHRDTLSGDPKHADSLSSALQQLSQACRMKDVFDEYCVQQQGAANVKPHLEFSEIFDADVPIGTLVSQLKVEA